IVEPETQLPGSDVRGLLFDRGFTVRRSEARTKTDGAVGRFVQRLWPPGNGLQRGQGLLEERDRLAVGGAGRGALARFAQVLDCRVTEIAASRMMGELLETLVA